MSARIIDGKKLSTAIKADVAERVAKLKTNPRHSSRFDRGAGR